VEAIEELISLGCPLDVRDHNMLTPVHVAAAEGHMEAVQAFLDKVNAVAAY
jgi:ankyrin repeat protein